MEDQADLIEEMERDPGTRPVCKALSSAQIKALRLGRVTRASLRELAARRLVCPADRPVFKPTPMGAQWRQTLIENERMRRALQRLREMVMDGEGRQDMLEVVMGGLG